MEDAGLESCRLLRVDALLEVAEKKVFELTQVLVTS